MVITRNANGIKLELELTESELYNAHKEYERENNLADIADNCENETYNCDTCLNNGDCINQGIDGRPKWEDEE